MMLFRSPVAGLNPVTRFRELYQFFMLLIKVFFFCVSKSTSVLLTLLIPDLSSLLSNRCSSCSRIILQNGYQLANRVSDICSDWIIHGNTMEAGSRSKLCVLSWILNCPNLIKQSAVCNFVLAFLPCRLHPPNHNPPPPRYSRWWVVSLQRPSTAVCCNRIAN
jgi:hypothetical protein